MRVHGLVGAVEASHSDVAQHAVEAVHRARVRRQRPRIRLALVANVARNVGQVGGAERHRRHFAFHRSKKIAVRMQEEADPGLAFGRSSSGLSGRHEPPDIAGALPGGCTSAFCACRAALPPVDVASTEAGFARGTFADGRAKTQLPSGTLDTTGTPVGVTGAEFVLQVQYITPVTGTDTNIVGNNKATYYSDVLLLQSFDPK